MAEVTLTDEEPFVNQNDFNAVDRNRNCSLFLTKCSCFPSAVRMPFLEW